MSKELKKIIEGRWELSYVSGVCIGIEKTLSNNGSGKYSRILLNTILPETDEEYAIEKEEIEGLMQYICDLHNNNQQTKHHE